MKISHFNTFPYGGAATAAKRIHRQLLQDGVESRFCYYRNEQESETDSSYQKIDFVPAKPGLLGTAVQKRLQRRYQKEVYRQFNTHLALRDRDAETFSMAQLPHPTHLDWEQIDADVVHLHWISFFADYPSFFGSIPKHIPLVWTLHDMNAFTGGCHYSGQCKQFRLGCGDCPQVINPGHRDVSRYTLEAKRKSLAKRRMHVVTPSRWLADLAQLSPVWPDNTTFQIINYGLDLQQFHPMDKQAARQQLGIQSNAILVGFGAEQVTNQRKGIQHLLAALRQIHQLDRRDEPQIECLMFGSGEIEQENSLPKMHQFGYVQSAETQRLIYSAADMVIVPSREDNQPQVGLEAMACGTPVIGFQAGGIPEYVRDGATGLIVKLGDETHLAERISWLAENHGARRFMGQRARMMMEFEFEASKQSAKYQSLYRKIATTQRSAAA